MVVACGLSSGARGLLEHRLSSCVTRAQLLQGTRAPPRPGILPAFLHWQADSSTELLGESLLSFTSEPQIYPSCAGLLFHLSDLIRPPMSSLCLLDISVTTLFLSIPLTLPTFSHSSRFVLTVHCRFLLKDFKLPTSSLPTTFFPAVAQRQANCSVQLKLMSD